jgi:putative transposase
MVEAALPGEVYELDAHRLNWVAVDRKGWPIGRLWVTVVLDRCTRCVVGQHVHVEPPSSLTVAAALRNAFAPKLYMLRRWPEIGRAWPCWGKPTLIILDNALENKATFLTEALMELGIAWHWAAARKPEEKPYVERYFGTMDSDLATRIPGWTGANPQEKGDYDSVQMSCLTEEDSDEIIHRWVVAYNIDTHTFNGMKVVPEQNWREATDLEVTPIEDLGMLDVLLGDYAVRRARRTGIELLGLRYGDKGDYRPIEAIRTRAGAGDFIDVRIRFDRSDLSHIHVQDPQTKEYIPVPSLDSKYTEGLTLARHRIIRRKAAERAKGYISIGELCAVRDDLQNRIDAMTGAEPMTERRYAAIFNGLGSKGSWAEFYRLSNEEYGRSRKDARPVVDLLEEDFEWTPGAAEAAPKEAPGAAGPAANEGAGTHEPAAPAEEPAAPGKDAAAPTAPDPAASPKPKGDLAARMKLLGME